MLKVKLKHFLHHGDIRELNDLQYFRVQVDSLAKKKGFNDDQIWLERCMFKELGELIDAVEAGKSETEIAEEFSDLMIFALQYMNKKTPNVDLNVSLTDKIVEDQNKPKKTYVPGEGIVKK